MTKLLAQNTFNFKKAVEGVDAFAPITNTGAFNFPSFVALGIRMLFVLIAVGFFLNLLYGSVQWIIAGGDKEGIEKARKRITTSLVGLAIGFSVYLVANLITLVTNVDILNTIAIPVLGQ